MLTLSLPTASPAPLPPTDPPPLGAQAAAVVEVPAPRPTAAAVPNPEINGGAQPLFSAGSPTGNGAGAEAAGGAVAPASRPSWPELGQGGPRLTAKPAPMAKPPAIAAALGAKTVAPAPPAIAALPSQSGAGAVSPLAQTGAIAPVTPAAAPLAPPAPEPPAATPAATEAPAETEAELFERIFGQPLPPDQAIVVPFSINDQRQGETIVAIAGGRASQVQAAPLLEKTSAILSAELQRQLESAVDSDGYLALAQLQQLGIATVFDQAQLALYLQIPPALRRPTVVGELGLPPEAAAALPVSTVSGYVNLLAGQDVVWSGPGATGAQPLRLALDGAVNVAGWVLEGSADVTAGGSPGFIRGDLRLVHDDPANALRYVAGDLSVPVSGAFQTVVPLGGLSVSRNYSLQPYRITRPTGEFSFFLERPSTVEVYVNGVRVQRLELQPGPQDLRNLALATGTNDIQLVITDDLGQVQRLDFATALAGNLLAPGLQQFSYSLGVPSRTEGGQRQYRWEQPQLALAHRWGVTPTLTLGAYAQITPTYQLLETDGVWASAAGNWGWDVAVSHANEVGVGVAVRGQYELPLQSQDSARRSFRATAEYRSDRFTTLGSLAPSADGLTLAAAYSQRVLGDTTLTLGGSYRLGRDRPDSYSANLGLARPLAPNLSGSLNLNHSRDAQGQGETRAFLGLSWVLPQQRQSFSSNSTLSSANVPSNRFTWNRNGDRRLQSPGFSVGVGQQAGSYELSGRLTYTDYRFDAALTQDLTWAAEAPTRATTRLTLGTALVFADGHWGWSRPIANSFVLVVPRDRWRGQTIGVNATGDQYAAVVNAFGPAVLPDVDPYYVSTVRLEAPEAPLGYDLGPSEFVVRPSYRSGTVIVAGTEATAFVRGILVDETGAPLGLQAGEVVSLSDADWVAQPLITNRVGRFVLIGLVPGRYEMRLRDRAPIPFAIAPDQQGLIDLGTLTVPPVAP